VCTILSIIYNKISNYKRIILYGYVFDDLITMGYELAGQALCEAIAVRIW
jgi:hypothetical protein